MTLFAIEAYNYTNERNALFSAIEQAKRQSSLLNTIGVDWNQLPFTTTGIPDNELGYQVDLISQQVDKVFCEIRPENDDQKAYLVLLASHTSNRLLMLIWRIFGIIPDPTIHGACQLLSSEDKDYLHFLAQVDWAVFELIKLGESYIRQWAEATGEEYLFEKPLDLFLEILLYSIRSQILEDGPFAITPGWKHHKIPNKYSRGPQNDGRSRQRQFIRWLQGQESDLSDEIESELRANGWAEAFLIPLRANRNCRSLKRLF